MNTKHIQILLIEDDPGHAKLIERNLKRANLDHKLIWLSDGQLALEYFFGENAVYGKNKSDPLLILLDLNLPGVSGTQILEQLKAHKNTQHIPVIVLTTTDDSNEINRCYLLGCNVYITKPVDFEKFSSAIQKLGSFIDILQFP